MSKFITIIRPDFMQFCGDACKAAALNHLLFRIAGKSKDQPKEKIQAGDILWYAKTEQITEEMSNAWGVCKVRQEVNGLISMGIIGRRPNPEWGADRTKHFSFGQEQCKVFLQYCEENSICVVHIGLPPEVMHLIYSSNANDKSIKCICAIHQMELIEISNANDEFIGAIPIDRHTIDDYQDDNKEESTFCANAPARTIPLKGVIFARANLEATAIHEERVIPFAEAGKRITDARLPAVKPSPKPKQQTTSSRPGFHDDAALVDPPAGASSASSDGLRASGDSQAPKSDTREIQRRINEHRGYALEEKVQIIQERQAIKSWCNLHSIEEYEQVMQRLRTDPYWGKEENYTRISGVTLAKETPKALASLARPPTNMGHAPPTDIYTQASLDPERNQRNIERLKARAAARQAAAEAGERESHGIA